MKIAYILYQSGVISGRSNGVRSQALTCFEILNEKGNTCVLINSWEHYEWNSFDAIHIFGYDLAIYSFVKNLSLKNSNIFISPIVDSTKPYGFYKLATFNGIDKLRLYSNNYALRKALKIVKGVCARSEHEAEYYRTSYSIEDSKINTIPLSYSINEPNDLQTILSKKEDFCFHLSSLYQERKNVVRLVKAAKKYGFKLVLAGNKGSEADFAVVQQAIGTATNITVLGFVSQEELQTLYSRAKVFALPSLNEGVGIVAMDAAVYGCNIAMTNLKGPRSYYPDIDNVATIDPQSIDSIGKSIMELLAISNSMELHEHMKKCFSREKIYSHLKNLYSLKS